MDSINIKDEIEKFKKLKEENPKEVAYLDAVETLELSFLLISKFEENPDRISITHNDLADKKINFSRIKFLLEDLKMANLIDYLIFALGGYAQFEVVQREAFKVRVLDDVKQILEKYEGKTKSEVEESAKELIDKKSEQEIQTHLNSFKAFVEKHGFKAFWLKESSGDLRKSPEEIGRQLLMAYLSALTFGLPLREVPTGAGNMDILFIEDPLKKSVIEIKVNPDKSRYEEGLTQLDDYLTKEGLNEGFYLIYSFGKNYEPEIEYKGKKILQISINIKQIAPTKAFRESKS